MITGSTPPTSKTEYYDNGVFLWASPADLGNVKDVISTKTKLSQQGFDKCRKIPAHSILVTCIGSTIGKMGMATTEMATNQQINSIIPIDCSPDYVYYSIQSRFPKYITSIATQAVPILSKSVFESLDSYKTSIEEQNKIGKLLHLLDERIDVQSKIIEELTTLRSALLEKVFQVSNPTLEVGAIAHQTSERNKLCRYSNVLSVSNRFGFINQSEQFEDRNVASDDVRNYKVVHRGDFAYNPARINVGSIAMLKNFESGIVSPMYICFQVDDTIVDPSFFELFLETKAFKDEMEIRLEGSVRRCLSFEALCEIHLPRPALLVQRSISDKIGNISSKIKLENRILRAYIRQKEWLLKQMFI